MTTIVSGSQVVDSTGALVASGTWSFNGTTLAVTNGVFKGGVTPGFGPVVIASGGVTILTIPNVTIGGGWFDWNRYKVSQANGIITGVGAPQIASIGGAFYTQTDSNLSAWTSLPDGGNAIWSDLTPPGSALAVSAGGTGAKTLSGVAAILGLVATTSFILDGTRTDTYIADGTTAHPFKTLDSLFAAFSATASAGNTGPLAVWSNPAASYSTANAISGPANPIIIYGNNSTWTFSAGVTLNGPTTIYDLNTVGAVSHAFTGATRSERHGGSYATGNITISGFEHWYGVQLTNTGGLYSVTVNGTLAGDFITGGMGILSGGTSAFIALNNINLQRASGYNFNMAAGGMLAIKGGYLTTAAGTFNIYLPTANSIGTSHAIEDITFVAGNGVSANGAAVYVGWANLSIPPSTALCPAFYALFNPWPVIAQPWVAQTAKTASITTSTVFTAPIAGLYRITASVRTTTAGSAGTVSVTSAGQTSGTADLTSLNSTASVSTTAYLAAGGTFALATTVAANTGAQYRVDYFVERVGQ